MDTLLTRMSNYNVINYVLAGVLFAALGAWLTGYRLIIDNILVAVFVYYFTGLIISRIGSFVVEPALEKLGFVMAADHGDCQQAEQLDEKVSILSEVNSMYRTLCALTLSLLLLKGYEQLEGVGLFSPDSRPVLLVAFLFVLFAFAYRYQTKCVVDRVAKLVPNADREQTEVKHAALHRAR